MAQRVNLFALSPAHDVTLLTCGAQCVFVRAPLEKESRSLKFYFESSSVRKKDLLRSQKSSYCVRMEGARAKEGGKEF
jgi:hypothetical protein